MSDRLVSVEALREICDPTEVWPWSGPVDEHWLKIAEFVHGGWRDPIGIDVGVPGLCSPDWPIHDGNHRFYAAILRGDDYIRAYVSGSLELANDLLRPTIPW